ncbi:MAG TPA: hypothetical protein VNS88_01705, partial [Nitrospiraceae bacterium]|nr:hypothetical protein [Nitrospiraceae bacterium]
MSTTENTPADPIAAMAAQQGVDLNQPAAEAAGGAGAPVPGTGQQSSPPQTATPPAEAQNTDTEQQSGGPPDNVPYPRFKEVNDQLRAFKELEAFGYDADSLRQLATWGAQFDQNPVDSWMAVAKELGDDLPPEIREAVAAHLGTQEATVQPQQVNQDGEDGDQPTWAKELKQRLDARDAADEQTARAQMLDGLVSKWKSADQKDGIPTIPDEKIYTYISGNAPGATNEDELFDLARKEFLDTREFILQGSVVKPGGSGAPVTVPGSGTPVNEAPPRPKTLAEATAAALADV